MPRKSLEIIFPNPGFHQNLGEGVQVRYVIHAPAWASSPSGDARNTVDKGLGRCREGNECAAGYSGAGCLFCAVDHFRLSNVCLSCSVVPWPLIPACGL